MSAFMSPLDIDSMAIMESSFQYYENPRGSMLVKLDIEHGEVDFSYQEENGRAYYKGTLRVMLDIRDEKDEDFRVARGAVKVAGAVSVDTGVGSREAALNYLKLNLVSIFYAHARSYFMLLVSMTPLQPIVLPPIDPKAYIESVDIVSE